jgi:hypothetical protein
MKATTRLQLTSGLLAAALLASTACGLTQPVTLLPTVGPDSSLPQPATGFLVVYTDTENPTNTGDIVYYPHTPYKIYDSHGALYRSVRNHLNERDEAPARVSLPPGRYTVVGRSEVKGEVAVPVIIGALRTTVVNLEKRSHEG